MRLANVKKIVKQIPQPLDPIGQRFLSHFHHGWGFIFAPTPKSGERPQWQTENRYPLQPRNLWQQYLDQSVLLGLRFDKETSYLLIDLDRKSKLHPANNLLKYKQLLGCLEEIGLCRPVPIQSSDSGGLHIYYFLAEKQPSFLLACAIKQTVEAAGFKIKGGELEIFPNCKVYSTGRPSSFNAHRLPLQAESYILDDILEPWSDDVEDLMDAADWSAAGQDYSALTEAISLAKFQKVIRFPYRKRSAIDQWRHDLEERISEGWTGHGQTNDLLKDIACYGIVFRHLNGQTLVDYIIITACQSPGYLEWCRHQLEIEQRAREWARCCEGFYTPYPGTPKRVNSYQEQFGTVDNNKIISLHPNEERQQQTIERIRAIVTQLQATETFPQRTSDRAQAIIAASKAQYGMGVSQTTLHKPIYLPLWHPDHQEKTDTKQPVNDYPESIRANLTAEKYPQLPDPWLEEQKPETQTGQETHLPAALIYTPPQYMKVLYMSSAKALPPATPIAELNQADKSLVISNSETSCNSSDYSKILNDLNHKQIQCLVLHSTAKKDNKQDLSNTENFSQTDIADVAQGIDSRFDNNLAIAMPAKSIASPDECTLKTKASVPVELLASTPLNTGSEDLLPAPAIEPLGSPQVETFTPEDYRQSIRLKLQASTQARHWVKVYCITENWCLQPQERIKLEQLAQRLLMLESQSLILQQEAQQWLAANPDVLEMAERLKQSKHDQGTAN
ncbi:hypothetical protein [Nostoc sp. FACHB-145]|uniref:hypothetical protein n=1 Tax=Nostoc sp. FACHB-145 TaxID=2692836 RepID=UPI001684F4D3|nr:hypothetical protein [Nostoc sp. FACHB-145]MBD2473069.1 hypothetical protein [Nostoc sp. FACHB-145]